MKRGDRYVVHADQRPCVRVFIEVTRVARDGSWADIFCLTVGRSWGKRQLLRDGQLPFGVQRGWTNADVCDATADFVRAMGGGGLAAIDLSSEAVQTGPRTAQELS